MDITSYLLGKNAGGGGGSNLQTKSVTVTINGTSTINPDEGYDGLTKVNLTTNVTPNNQSKAITITENGTTSVTPDTGYDGLSSVSVTTNVSGGSSDLDWTALGYTNTPQQIINDYNYSKNIKDNWVSATDLTEKFKNNSNLIYMPLVDTSQATSMNSMFYGCSELNTLPPLDTSNVTDTQFMFLSCYKISTIPPLDTSKVTNMRQMFYSCYKLITIPMLNAKSVSSSSGFLNMFSSTNNLSNESLDNILKMCISATSYPGVKTLAKLGLSSTYYPASTIQALPNYQDFIAAGWTIGY